MLLPILGMFAARDSAGMILCFDHKNATCGNYYVVDLGGASVGGGEEEVVDDDGVFLFQFC